LSGAQLDVVLLPVSTILQRGASGISCSFLNLTRKFQRYQLVQVADGMPENIEIELEFSPRHFDWYPDLGNSFGFIACQA